MSKVNALVLTGFGLNCDRETAHAFELAGASSHCVHINALINGSVRLEDHHVLIFIGGFGWGDDHGAGVVQAVRFKTNLGDRILEFVDRGRLVLGICNGFQALVNLGLLPGFDGDYRSRSVALTHNECGNFRNQWVRLNVDQDSPCIFTRGIQGADLPVRHGEGKFYAEEGVIRRLQQDHQVVLRYALADGSPAAGRFPDNPNGSVDDIAGICDPTGRIFGLMPHPEAYHDPTNHPDWLRERERARRQGRALEDSSTVGVRMLANAVQYIQTK
jgi:phosphoribosylformylglycinamidine synthase